VEYVSVSRFRNNEVSSSKQLLNNIEPIWERRRPISTNFKPWTKNGAKSQPAPWPDWWKTQSCWWSTASGPSGTPGFLLVAGALTWAESIWKLAPGIARKSKATFSYFITAMHLNDLNPPDLEDAWKSWKFSEVPHFPTVRRAKPNCIRLCCFFNRCTG
jgi:hypothetical protein